MFKETYSDSRFMFRLLLLSLMFFILTNVSFLTSGFAEKKTNVKTSSKLQNTEVAGWWGSQKPVIYISGGSYKFSSGGLIPLASTDDPVVEVSSYNIEGSATFELYEANREALFSYLLYKDDNTQINNEVDRAGFKLVTSFEKTDLKNESKISLPLADRGVYYLKVSTKDLTTNAYIVRSNIASVVKEAGDEFVFWSQDLRSKKSLTSGNVKLYNLKDKVTEISNVSIGNDGVAKTGLTAEADIALIVQDDETAVVPVNLRYLNSGYDWDRFQNFKLNRRYLKPSDLL